MKPSPIPTFIKYDPQLIPARGEGKLWFREGSDMKGRAARPAQGSLCRAAGSPHAPATPTPAARQRCRGGGDGGTGAAFTARG